MVRTREAGAAIRVWEEEVSVVEGWGTRIVDRPAGGGQVWVVVEDMVVLWFWRCVVVKMGGSWWYDETGRC